jgi:PAS domain S-box-containing protein
MQDHRDNSPAISDVTPTQDIPGFEYTKAGNADHSGSTPRGSLIGEVGTALTRSDTLHGLLQLCAEALVRHLDVAAVCIWIINETENVLELRASAGLDAHIEGARSKVPLDQFKMGRISQERAPHIAIDVLTDLRIRGRDWAGPENMVGFAAYPLMVDDRLLGSMEIFARHPVGTAAVEAIGSVAHQIALGIEHNRANQTLREREEHIRLLLDSTAEAIYGIDLQGRCTFANPACARLLGYGDPSHFLGRNMHDLMHHTRKDGAPYPVEECRIFLRFLQNQASHVDDEVLWRADGTSFPAEYWSHPICRDGKVAGAVVTFLDITERRQLEEQFRRAQQHLRDVVASSPAVLFTLALTPDEVQGVSWISDNLREILGYPLEAAIGPDWWLEKIHPEDLDGVTAPTLAELFSRSDRARDLRFRHADGHYRWFRCETRLIHDETGQPVGAVGAWSDITERRLAEEEQLKLREQLQQAQKLESIGRLAGGVAHDFNNLLTVINGYGDLLLKQLTPADPLYKMADEIRKAGQRAAELTRQLLLLSRKQVTQPAEVNLNDVIAEVERMLNRVIGEDIQLKSTLSPLLGHVLADPGQLHQVLMNLAVNARDAMPNGGTLLIETRNVDLDDAYTEQHPEMRPGPYVQLRVSDTGIGMTKDVMSHLFEPFYTTKKPGEGTGLGLATVYGIVKQSGGSIWTYSEPGKGTAFTIYLPRIMAGVRLKQESEPELESLRGTETILVVEDQEQLRKMAGSVLRSYGYRVLEAANPGEALLHCERYAGPIHLLLTDIAMPGITGPELADRVKPLRPAMEVVFMSGYSERAIADRLDLTGRYLAKPFSPDELASKVRGVLGAPRRAGTILVADDEPGVRSFLRDVLAGVGYDILEAEDGKEAVRKVETTQVDLVILDLAMPEQEGIETIQVLRRLRPQLRIIAVSGQFAGFLLRAAEQLGAQMSLAKPIEANDLLDAVARVMVGHKELS